MPNEPGGYFKAGGTLHVDTPSYVKRPADDLLFQQLLSGQLCYVLTTRQMGKSSLMIRTAARLQEANIQTAIVDLSSLGVHLNSEQWYLGILTELSKQLNLSIVAKSWWEAQRGTIGVVQRFSDFIREVVLATIPGRIVIFFDEIDSTLSLAFTDDFFAALRAMYNERAVNADYERLTFALLGVAAPASLIKDRNRTPFNVGRGIDLVEFSRDDAQPLTVGLDAAYPNAGTQLLDRIFYWTSGHPYLTQKICQTLVEKSKPVGQSGAGMVDSGTVDSVVDALFLKGDAQNEENLQFVRSRVFAYAERRSLLRLYRSIFRGEKVGDDERSILHNELKLIGLTAARHGVLQVRNEIYRRVFNLDWVKASIPTDWARIVTISATAVSVLTIAALVFYPRWRDQQQVASLSKAFADTQNADIRITYLAGICTLDADKGRALFNPLNDEEKVKVFQEVKVGENFATVVTCIQPLLMAQPNPTLTQAICEKAEQTYDIVNVNTLCVESETKSTTEPTVR